MSGETAMLTEQNVRDIFMACLSREDENTDKQVVAEGVVMTAGFHPGRLEAHRNDIHQMLSELPDTFRASGDGGWSFLNAIIHRNGSQWTDYHQTVDQLMMLGLAIEEVEYLLPREYWPELFGGMPYIVVHQ